MSTIVPILSGVPLEAIPSLSCYITYTYLAEFANDEIILYTSQNVLCTDKLYL